MCQKLGSTEAWGGYLSGSQRPGELFRCGAEEGTLSCPCRHWKQWLWVLMMQWPPGRSTWFREGSLIELHLPSWLGGSSTYRCLFAKTLAEDASSVQSSEHRGWLGDTVLLILGNSDTATLPVASQCPQHFEESAMEARFSFISWSPRTSQSHMLSSLGPWLLDDCWTCGVVSCGVAMRCFCMATVPQVTYT